MDACDPKNALYAVRPALHNTAVAGWFQWLNSAETFAAALSKKSAAPIGILDLRHPKVCLTCYVKGREKKELATECGNVFRGSDN